MTDSSVGADPLELLLDEFTSRCRGGESPSISEYAARHPRHAARIEALFPAIAAMEELRAVERWKRDALSQRSALAHPPEHLGDFHILQEIGRGGMGIVYEAEQRSLARPVAVKVLPAHAHLRGKSLQRFQREARTAARLHHTSIVPVYGVGEQDGLHYYVMPLVRGVSLDEVIRELRAHRDLAESGGRSCANAGSPFQDIGDLVSVLTAKKFATRPAPGRGDKEKDRSGQTARVSPGGSFSHWRTVAHIAVQVADALDYAHGQGTLHRDIKPGNLLLDEDGVVSVADFGLARAMDCSGASHSGDFVGTACYMAPEQLHGTADARSDLYALGLTLFELLTLQPAFDSREQALVPRAGQGLREPTQPRRFDPAIPRDLETIVLKCLAYEPERRYQTAAALAADLRRFIEDRPICARRASPLERASRWCRRNPALATASGLALASLMAVAVTALVGYLETTRAYAETRQALKRSETTSQVALEALNGIYQELSPERIWIASDADPAGQTCACIGLRAGDGSASSIDRAALRVRASPQTALLLENLLVFYDRLAAEGGDDEPVMLESAIASRRVGDIRLCLGRMDQAEQEYLRAVAKLSALGARRPEDWECATELARNYNEIGNICAARREARRAWEHHQAALGVLQSCAVAERPAAEYQYELARTFYFLAGRIDSAAGDTSGGVAGVRTGPSIFTRSGSNEYRRSAIRILEGLTRSNPAAPDYRLLLALCYRGTGGSPDWTSGSGSSQGRHRAIEILEELTAEYPEVADYRYELIATYAWLPVSLFPWQGRSSISSEKEQSLRKAVSESERLVAHNPSVPHYARCQALVLAKLATACWRNQRLAEAEELFQRAVQTQAALVTRFPDTTPHDQVLLQFYRLRLAEVGLDRDAPAKGGEWIVPSQELLEQCVEGLTRLTAAPELAQDQLARSSLSLAREALGEVRAKRGERQEAREPKGMDESLRNEMDGKNRPKE